jgi:hypothetical protein
MSTITEIETTPQAIEELTGRIFMEAEAWVVRSARRGRPAHRR